MTVHFINTEEWIEEWATASSRIGGVYNKHLLPLCGCTDITKDRIPLNEIPYMDAEYMAALDICEDCQDHPDFILALLGSLP